MRFECETIHIPSVRNTVPVKQKRFYFCYTNFHTLKRFKFQSVFKLHRTKWNETTFILNVLNKKAQQEWKK